MSPIDEEGARKVDERLRAWRQGDCVVGDHLFLFRLDAATPLTPEASVAANDNAEAAEAEVRGLMVATQTCDVVRACAARPFVEVCPLVLVEPGVLDEVRRNVRPNYALVPALAGDRLVADLDRVMTVEKSVLAAWDRTPGTTTNDDARRLAQALARDGG